MKLYNIIKEERPKFVPRDLEDREQKFVDALIKSLNVKVYKGNLTLDLSKIPKGTSFNVQQIKGNVYISNDNKQSVWKDLSFFKNLKSVDGYFSCSWNNLTSLQGCPKIVNKWFNYSWNNLTSLYGCPTRVGNSFNCSNQNNGHKFTEQDVENNVMLKKIQKFKKGNKL